VDDTKRVTHSGTSTSRSTAFPFEINSQRIWHYQGDSYVHRIIKRKEAEKPDSKEFVFADHATSSRDGTLLAGGEIS